MLKLIFSLDYEIHGNGDGNPYDLMIEPTARLMDLFDQYGAKLVIFADVAEIIKFKEYRDQFGRDDYYYEKIIDQLRDAVLRGHDVQLHIHSSYFSSSFVSGKWMQNWEKYNLAGLSYEEINNIVKVSKLFLEEIVKPVKPEYECYVFRAANWAMLPTENIALALSNNGIQIDSSVYKYGKQTGWVNYDYSNAFDAIFPYKSSNNNINYFDPNGSLLEFPIYCELKPLINFLSYIRIFRALRALKHKHNRVSQPATINNKFVRNKLMSLLIYIRMLTTKQPRKFDFNQLSAEQMINTLKNIKNNRMKYNYVVLIGHSKSYILYNKKSLEKLFTFLNENNDAFEYSLYPPKADLNNFRQNY